MRKYIGEPSLDGGVYSLEQHSDFIRAHLGKLEMAFRQIRRIEVEDTTESTSRFDGGVDLSGTNKWIGGVLAPNGKIYGIPYNSTTVLCIDGIGSMSSAKNALTHPFFNKL